MDSVPGPKRRLPQGVYYGSSKISRPIGAVGMVESAYAADTILPEHTHEQDHLVLVVKGLYQETIDGKRVERKPEQLLYLPRDVPHAEHHWSHGRHFMIDPPRICLDHVGLTSVNRRAPDVMPIEASKLAKQLRARFLDPDWASPVGVQVQLLDLLIHCSPALGVVGFHRPPPFLRRAIDIVSTRFDEPLTIIDVAREVGVHPRRLARTFKTWYGAALRQLRLERRLEFACHRLRHTKQPLCDVATDAGFYDQSYFSKVFRRAVGVSPDMFRRAPAR